MRVLASVEHLGISGVVAVALEHARALRARGHEVLMFAIPGPIAPRVRSAGIDIVGQPRTSVRPDVPSAVRLWRAAARAQVDVVHAYALRPCLEAFLGTHVLGGVPMVASLMHNPNRTTPAYLPRTIPLVVGRETAAEELRAWGAASVRAVRAAVSPDAPASATATAAFRADHRLEPGERVVLVVSQLDLTPNLLRAVETTIAAVELLASRDPRVRLVIVGDGGGRGQVEARACAVNARARREVVTLVGNLVELAPAFAACDVVVAMATSALRGMAYGKPTLVSGPDGHVEVPDADAFERYRGAGVFAPAGGAPDAAAESHALSGLLADPARAGALAELERQETATHWSADAAAVELERVYHEAVMAKPRRPDEIRDAVRVAWWYSRSRLESLVRRFDRTDQRMPDSRNASA